MNLFETEKDGYWISTDVSKLDVQLVYNFLTHEAYWSRGISYKVVVKSIEHSLNFGIYFNNEQVGYARVISDYATIAYLGDVFVVKDYRGKGLSKWLMDVIMVHPHLQGLRRWILLTSTAAGLYEKYGFNHLPNPDIYLEKYDPNIYK